MPLKAGLRAAESKAAPGGSFFIPCWVCPAIQRHYPFTLCIFCMAMPKTPLLRKPASSTEGDPMEGTTQTHHSNWHWSESCQSLLPFLTTGKINKLEKKKKKKKKKEKSNLS